MHDEVRAAQLFQQVAEQVVEDRRSPAEHHKTRASSDCGVAPPKQIDGTRKDVLALAVAHRADVRHQQFAGLQRKPPAQLLADMSGEPGVNSRNIDPARSDPLPAGGHCARMVALRRRRREGHAVRSLQGVLG